MTVHELVELLNDQDPDAEVKMAFQPSWPLAFEVAGVYDELNYADDTDTVWIVQGSHPDDHPYAPQDAWNQVLS